MEKLFFKLPYFLQFLLLNIQAFRVSRVRYNKTFKEVLRSYQDRADRIEIDMAALQQFLVVAEQTPFWKQKFSIYGVETSTNDPIAEIAKLPILTKKEVRANVRNISIHSKKITYSRTSGTTGSGLVFPQTHLMENHQWAVWWRFRYRHGLKLDSWCVWFGGRSILSSTKSRPPYWIKNYPMRQLMMSAHHLNEDTVAAYFQCINSSKIPWLHGYPSQITLFAHLIKEQKLGKLENIRIITTGSENLLESQRRIMREVFGCEIYNHYGLAEGVSNISQLPNSDWEMDQDFSFTELLPLEDDPKTASIIGTNYRNTAFPLIRYETGDLANIVEKSEGRFCVVEIEGRNEDYITLPNGTRLGRLDHIFKDLVNIDEAQIYQPNINNIEIRLVKGPGYDSKIEEVKLLKETRLRLGESVNIKLNYLDKIPRTSSGKLKFVISEVKAIGE